MVCPICKKDTFIELASREPNYMGEGWSIKECLVCGYKVEDVTIDGRFVKVDHVIRKPDMNKVNA